LSIEEDGGGRRHHTQEVRRVRGSKVSEAARQRPVELGEVDADPDPFERRLDARGELRRALAVLGSARDEVVQLRDERWDGEQADENEHERDRDIDDHDRQRAIQRRVVVDAIDERRQQVCERPRGDEDDDDVRDLCDGDPTESEHLDRQIHDREHHQGLQELMFPRAQAHGAHGMGARDGYHRLP